MLGYSLVRLLPVGDTSRTYQDISDSTGFTAFRLPDSVSYKVQVQTTGFTFRDSLINMATAPDTIVLRAQVMSNALKGVTVTSRKLMMRQEDDKTIIDPEEIAATSTNAFEMMEKVPALFIDQDGNIFLNSTTPATVYINGREQKMSTADIATILRSLPPNAVERIEILRSPSARYDASGGGGIVNVVLRKGVKIGFTGNVSAGFNQGTYGNQHMGISINNNNGATSYNLNLHTGRRNSWDRIATDRRFSPDSVLSQDAYTTYPAQNVYLGYGISHELDSQWSISYDGRLSLNVSENETTNPSAIRRISTGEESSRSNASIGNDINSYNINQGFQLKYKADTAGSEWVTDLSYSYSPNKTEQQFNTSFELPYNFALSGDGSIDNRLHYFSVQSNYIKKLPKQLSFEGGLKTTNVWFSNTTRYFNNSGTIKLPDNFRTRAYDYNEHIHAAYVQGSKTLAGITLKLGTRAENTNMLGHQQVPSDTSFTLRRTDFFPYAYLSRSIMKIAGYDVRAYLIYRRTISRPSYEYLNPYTRYIDQYLFETGNPSLRPQFTKNYEANISVDERPLLAIGYNDTRDIFTQVVYQSETNRSLAYRTYDNLGTNKETYFRFMGAIPPTKKFFFVAGGQYNHNFYEGLYEGAPLSFKRGSWSFFTYQRFMITPVTQLSLNGFMRLNGISQFYELSGFGALNLSLSHKFFDKKLNVTMSVNDVFFTNNNKFTLDQGSVYATGMRRSDTRRFGMNILYNFGFRKKEEHNMFNVESPDKAN